MATFHFCCKVILWSTLPNGSFSTIDPQALVITTQNFWSLLIFEASWTLLITSCEMLPNLLLTNRSRACKKMFWNRFLQTHTFFGKIHGMCKHCQIVIFHIFLRNVCNLFHQCSTFFVYFLTHCHAAHSTILSITFFHYVFHVLISSKCWRGFSLVSSLRYSIDFFVIS